MKALLVPHLGGRSRIGKARDHLQGDAIVRLEVKPGEAFISCKTVPKGQADVRTTCPKEPLPKGFSTWKHTLFEPFERNLMKFLGLVAVQDVIMPQDSRSLRLASLRSAQDDHVVSPLVIVGVVVRRGGCAADLWCPGAEVPHVLRLFSASESCQICGKSRISPCSNSVSSSI